MNEPASSHFSQQYTCFQLRKALQLKSVFVAQSFARFTSEGGIFPCSSVRDSTSSNQGVLSLGEF